MEFKEAYDLLEVADMLKVTRRTVYNYVKAGGLKTAKVGNRHIVTRKNLLEFLEAGTAPGYGDMFKRD